MFVRVCARACGPETGTPRGRGSSAGGSESCAAGAGGSVRGIALQASVCVCARAQAREPGPRAPGEQCSGAPSEGLQADQPVLRGTGALFQTRAKVRFLPASRPPSPIRLSSTHARGVSYCGCKGSRASDTGA